LGSLQLKDIRFIRIFFKTINWNQHYTRFTVIFELLWLYLNDRSTSFWKKTSLKHILIWLLLYCHNVSVRQIQSIRRSSELQLIDKFCYNIVPCVVSISGENLDALGYGWDFIIEKLSLFLIHFFVYHLSHNSIKQSHLFSYLLDDKMELHIQGRVTLVRNLHVAVVHCFRFTELKD